MSVVVVSVSVLLVEEVALDVSVMVGMPGLEDDVSVGVAVSVVPKVLEGELVAGVDVL